MIALFYYLIGTLLAVVIVFAVFLVRDYRYHLTDEEFSALNSKPKDKDGDHTPGPCS